MEDDTLSTPDPRVKRLFRIMVGGLVVGAVLLGIFWLRSYTDPIERYQPLLEETVNEYAALSDAQEELLAGPEAARRSGRFQTEWEELAAQWEALDDRAQKLDHPPEFTETHAQLLRTVHEHTLAAQALRDAPSSGAYEIHLNEARLAGADFRAALEAESRPFSPEDE